MQTQGSRVQTDAFESQFGSTRGRGSRWASASPCSPDSPRLVGCCEQGLPTLAAQAWDRGGVYAHTRTHTCACTHGAPASALAVSRKQSCLREKAERADLYIERCRSFLYGKGSFQLFLLNVDLFWPFLGSFLLP